MSCETHHGCSNDARGLAVSPEGVPKDRERCWPFGVPAVCRVMKTRADLGPEIVRRQRTLGTRLHWIATDGLWGKDPAFLRGLDDGGETFVVEVHRSQWVTTLFMLMPRIEQTEHRPPQSCNDTEVLLHLTSCLAATSWQRRCCA